MSEFDNMATDMRRKIRADLFGNGAIDDSIMAKVQEGIDDSYDPVMPLPRMTIRASAYYDEKTSVMTSADVEVTTARLVDRDLILALSAAIRELR